MFTLLILTVMKNSIRQLTIFTTLCFFSFSSHAREFAFGYSDTRLTIQADEFEGVHTLGDGVNAPNLNNGYWRWNRDGNIFTIGSLDFTDLDLNKIAVEYSYNNSDPNPRFEIYLSDPTVAENKIAEVAITNTGGWDNEQDFQESFTTDINLPENIAGIHPFYLKLAGGVPNVKSISLERTFDGIDPDGSYALQFPGGRNYVSVNHFPVTEELSVEAWIRTDQSSTGSIVTWKNPENNGEAVLFRVESGKLEFGEWIGGKWNSYKSAANVNTGSWLHVAAVRGPGSLKLYINGAESYSNTATALPNSLSHTTTLSIGAIQTDTSGGINPDEVFIGNIDEVRIWQRTLSETEINQNMLSSTPVNSEKLKACFNFNGNVSDQSGNGNHGTIVGSLTYVPSDILHAPELSLLAFEEEAGHMPLIKAKGNKTGTLFWAIAQSTTAVPTPEAIEAGGDFTACGNFAYTYANAEVQQSLTHIALEQGQSYRIHGTLKVGAHYSAVFSSSAFTYQALQQLPAGWFNTDVGSVGVKGSTTYADNRFTIAGSGSDISGNRDAFQYACLERSGDTELTAYIESQENTNGWAKSGVMIRSSLDDNAGFIMMAVAPEGGIHFSYRNETNWNQKMYFSDKTINAPIWLKLIYKEGYALGYYSADGVAWERVQYPVRLATSGTYYAGLAACSHDNSRLGTSTFSQIAVDEPDASVITKEKGSYFSQKSYIDDPIPVFSEDKDELPAPILDANPEWIDLYWKSWEIAFSHIIKPQAGSNHISNYYDDSFNSDIFQWDIIFMTLFGKYANHLFPAAHSLNNFYANQHKDGLIVRQITLQGDDAVMGDPALIFPPLFSWAEMENYKITPDKERLRQVLPVLEKYVEYIEGYHRGWDTEHQLYWTHGYASGMDNTPRDNGRPNGHSSSDHQGWTDLSAQMVIQCKNIADLCHELGESEKETYYRNMANEIGKRINQFMWNEADGLYYDVDVDSRQTFHKTIACFWPMLAEITSDEQNERLVANLKDPQLFWRDMVFPTLAADQPEYKDHGGYWLGGVWAPTNYATIKGLSVQGYHALAKEASERYVEGMNQVYKTTGTIWENYAPEKINGNFRQGVSGGDGQHDCRSNFVGWSGLGPIALLIEEIIGIQADGVKNQVVWYLDRLDRNGIKKLHFGNGIITDLICDEREQDSSDAFLTVTSNKPYELIVYKSGTEYKFSVAAGENHLVCSTATDINHPGKEDETRLFPNPAQETLFLTQKGEGKCEVKITDLLGRTQQQAVIESAHAQLDISNLSRGNYLVILTTRHKSEVKSLIIE